MLWFILGRISAGEQPQGRAVVFRVQFLTGPLGLCQRADGFFRLPHQGQLHLFIVCHSNHLLHILGHIVH